MLFGECGNVFCAWEFCSSVDFLSSSQVVFPVLNLKMFLSIFEGRPVLRTTILILGSLGILYIFGIAPVLFVGGYIFLYMEGCLH